MSVSEFYNRRRSAGLCATCGAKSVKSNCESCRDKQRQRETALYQQRRAAGLCVLCAEQAGEGRAVCATCQAKRTARVKATTVDGLCIHCKQPTNRMAKSCLACYTKYAAKRKTPEHRAEINARRHLLRDERLAKKLCIDCGANKDTENKRCPECQTGKHSLYLRLIRDAICIRCRKPRGVSPSKAFCVVCNEKAKANSVERHATIRRTIIAAYGGRCACCGESNPIFLEIDHVNNDGAKHRKEVGLSRVYKWIIENNYPPTMQLLCSNCNRGKAKNNGRCPHEDEAEEFCQEFNDNFAGLARHLLQLVH